MHITRHKPFATNVCTPLPAGLKGVYGLGLVWQLGPSTLGVIANIRAWGSDTIDLELGSDLILADPADPHTPGAAVPLNRARYVDTDPGGRGLISVYPVSGGFVPLGARRADGSPHPHAGTGFSLCMTRTFPVDDGGIPTMPYLGESGQRDPFSAGLELQQLRFDGKQVHVESSELRPNHAVMPGYMITRLALGCAIPDGDDLLWGAIALPTDAPDDTNAMPHLVRWRRLDGRWQAIAMHPVCGDEGHIEPSLVRDADGSLLYSARSYLPRATPRLLVWRSPDGGRSWDRILDADGVRSQAPVTIGGLPDGTVYLASCPRRGPDAGINQRDALCLWPLAPDRTRLLDACTARDCPAELGPPVHQQWRVDHPVGTTVQLADGTSRHLLGYRIMEAHGAPPTPHTGVYIEAVTPS